MSRVDGFQEIAAIHAAKFGESAGAAEGVPEGAQTFAETLKSAVGDVNDMQVAAGDAISDFLAGEPVEIHQVMAAASEAGIALEMLIEIRNKLTEAYRAVIQMQQ